jgi:hypothetical protein
VEISFTRPFSGVQGLEAESSRVEVQFQRTSRLRGFLLVLESSSDSGPVSETLVQSLSLLPFVQMEQDLEVLEFYQQTFPS